MLKYGVAHPGKIGDFLYILPTVSLICRRDGAMADIYTSEMCRPTESLIRYQKYVNDFIIPPEYKIAHSNQGVQPWQMPVPDEYDKIYQLGFEHFPHDGPLHLYIAKKAGLETVPDPQYDYPDKKYYDKPYVVVAYCGHHTDINLQRSYKYFIENNPYYSVLTGSKDDKLQANGGYYDQTGIDFLDLASLISGAIAYVGFFSGQLAIANGFPGLLKIITSSRSGGENHALNINKTINLPNNTTGPEMVKILIDNLE